MITSNNEHCNQNLVDEGCIINIGGFTTMDEDSCFDNVDVLEGSFTLMDHVATLLWPSVGVKPNTWKK
jgi:hypothetical protein